MSNKTHKILKIIAVSLVILGVALELQLIAIPSLSVYRFWFVVIAFGVMLLTSK